jgi:hypothetical protein
MAEYTIMGGDGKEYGPVDAHQVKTWIREHRLEKKSPVIVDAAKDWAFLESLPEFASALKAQSEGASPPIIGKRGGLNAIIPYKNPRALVAYYFGVFAVLPLIGIVFGLVALALGISGLRFRRRMPEAGGAVHAWIGILAGGFFALLWLALVGWVIVLKLRNH